MKEIVVTGAAGFLGKAVVARLESAGMRALGVDRGQELPRSPEAVCIHLAADNDPAALAQNFERLRVNAVTLARDVLAADYKRVVFASSALVYGGSAVVPRAENSPTTPDAAMGRLKLELEGLFAKGPHAVARVGNLYGRGMSEQNVVSAVLRQLPGGGTIKLSRGGDVRDFLFVEDAAKALARLALSQVSGVYNVGTGIGTRVEDLAATLAKIHGRSDVKIEAPFSNQSTTLVLNASKIRRDLDWKAETTLAEGLKTLIALGKS